jgi:hypothetical protein
MPVVMVFYSNKIAHVFHAKSPDKVAVASLVHQDNIGDGQEMNGLSGS